MQVPDVTSRAINQTDCRADTTAKGFIWANISTSNSGPEED